jgi:glycosyl hydrolase family 25
VTMLYIDVSHYDWSRYKGNLDWAKIKANGVDVVFIRASYGDPAIYNPETRYFVEMAQAAKAAGLRVGGYHNLINGDFESIKRQVTYFREQLNLVNADFAMVDVEPYEALKTNDLWPRLPAAELFAQEFWLQDSRRKLAVYLAQWVWSGWLNRADLRPLMAAAGGPLINANYPLGTTKGSFTDLYSQAGGDTGKGWEPYGNVTPDIWQYSSNAIVPGASPVTDVNAFRGTLDQFVSKLEVPMAWFVVPALEDLRLQLNAAFPNRDKSSDGGIGDTSHAARPSSHNPDLTGSPEYRDGDSKDEVRARDFDKDLKDSSVSAEDVVQHLIKGAKSGRFWWLRYIIYNRRIWSKSNNWSQATYSGSNPHDHHFHVNSDFTQSADTVDNVDYGLDELKPKPNRTVTYQYFTARLPVLKKGDSDPIEEDGAAYVKRAQRALIIEADGDYGPLTTAAVKDLNIAAHDGTVIDLPIYVRIHALWGAEVTDTSGSLHETKRELVFEHFGAHLPILKYGDSDDRNMFEGNTYFVTRAQRQLGVTADGDYGPETADAVKELMGSGDGKTIDLPVWIKLYGMFGAELQERTMKLQKK